ncbi:MAG: hypothetical protein ONA90_04250, partial [candidate division KSB1 bacterium]|nr:hypothetical protein [candidate division KSB1 bacterium]
MNLSHSYENRSAMLQHGGSATVNRCTPIFIMIGCRTRHGRLLWKNEHDREDVVAQTSCLHWFADKSS